VVPFRTGEDFVRVEIRGLHLRPTYVPAFLTDQGDPAKSALVLPLQGSASADADSLSGIFQKSALPVALHDLLKNSNGVIMAASEVPLAIVDGELGRLVQGPAVTTWPKLQPAGVVNPEGSPSDWHDILPNQRFVPQSPSDPADPEVADDCLADYDEPEEMREQALRRLREMVDEGDSAVPLEKRVQKIQLRREVRDFVVAALQQQPPAPSPTDTEAHGAAGAAGAGQHGREN
jgi:hypothetical protein